jgi:hypothetical protein
MAAELCVAGPARPRERQAGPWGLRTLLGSFAALVDWVLRLPLPRRFRDRGMREMRSYYRSATRLGTQPASFYG